MTQVTDADRDAAARCLGYANWCALMYPSPIDSCGVRIPSIGLKWQAERAAEQIARYREQAVAGIVDWMRDYNLGESALVETSDIASEIERGDWK